jgi:hypothetical protein
LIAGNISLFAQILAKTSEIKSILEFDANIGNNLGAAKHLLQDCDFSAIENNKKVTDIFEGLKYLTILFLELVTNFV